MTTASNTSARNNKRHTFAVRVCAGIAAVTVALGACPTPQAQAKVLGGLNIESFCQKWYGGSYHAALRWKGVFGWRCNNRYGDRDVNYWQACAMQYGDRATAFYQDYNNPYSWLCGRPG